MTVNRAPRTGTRSSRANNSPTKAPKGAEASLSGPRSDDRHELGTSEEVETVEEKRQPVGPIGKAELVGKCN